MGAYSPLPDLPDDGRRERSWPPSTGPILAELARRGTPFRGALYAGLMLTDDGPVLLECNARFGDPETQAILPRLAVALGPILLAAARGDLSPALAGSRGPRRRACRPSRARPSRSSSPRRGYPDAPRSGDAIDGLADAAATGRARLPRRHDAIDGDGTVRTTGGRVLSVVGRGADLAAAAAAATRAADLIHAPGLAAAARHRRGRRRIASRRGPPQPAGSLAR